MTDKIGETPAKTKILLPLYFLPNLEYFAALLPFDTIVLEACELLPRRTYRNRCHVLTANKIDTLTVPLVESRRAVPIREARIDYRQPWVRRHWGCLQSAYGKSPFYEYYAADLEAVYNQEFDALFDFNAALLTLCLKFLGVKKPITYTLSHSLEVGEGVFDAKSLINNRKATNSMHLHNFVPYYQTFGNDFVSNLSIIDLLFNKGPESRQVLSQPAIVL